MALVGRIPTNAVAVPAVGHRAQGGTCIIGAALGSVRPGCEQPLEPGGPVREWRESWALHPRDAATTVRTLPEASVDSYIDLTQPSDRLARTSKPPVPTGCVP